MMKEEMDSESSKEESKKYGKYGEWEIECAAKTLHEAEEIKSDPEKLKYVKAYMEQKLVDTKKTITSIDELKALAKEKSSPVMEDES